jgi:hypothetical protein
MAYLQYGNPSLRRTLVTPSVRSQGPVCPAPMAISVSIKARPRERGHVRLKIWSLVANFGILPLQSGLAVDKLTCTPRTG